MQRRKHHGGFELPQHRRIDAAMLPQPGTAMHQPMADGGRRRQLGIIQQPADAGDGLSLVGNGAGFGQQLLAARVLRMDFCLALADRFRLTGEQQFGV